MEEYLVTAVGYLRLVVEAIGAAVIGYGVLATTFRYILTLIGVREDTYNEIRLYLGQYLVLGLEFQLGADILATAVAPTLDDVILLGAIATIRTVLNYFLSQELERERREAAADVRARRHDRLGPRVETYDRRRESPAGLRASGRAARSSSAGIVRGALVARGPGGRSRVARRIAGARGTRPRLLRRGNAAEPRHQPHLADRGRDGPDHRRAQAADVSRWAWFGAAEGGRLRDQERQHVGL